MNKNTKKILSALTIVGLSSTTLSANFHNLVHADNDVRVIQTQPEVNVEVIENEEGALLRIVASMDVENGKLSYSVDGGSVQELAFGKAEKGIIKEIQLKLDDISKGAGVSSNGERPKVKVLPNTAAVSDKVSFSKVVKGHSIRGYVSFVYDDETSTSGTRVSKTDGAISSGDDSKPSDIFKPTENLKPTTPTESKPADVVKPSLPSDPSEVKPSDIFKPEDTNKPVEPKPADVVKPTEQPKPTTPTETKPVEKPKPTEQPKDTWREETRNRTVQVDENYTDYITEDVYEEKPLYDDWHYLVKSGTREWIMDLGWVDELPSGAERDQLCEDYEADEMGINKIRSYKKVKVGTKQTPVTKTRKVDKQEKYTVWINNRTGEERTTRP